MPVTRTASWFSRSTRATPYTSDTEVLVAPGDTAWIGAAFLFQATDEHYYTQFARLADANNTAAVPTGTASSLSLTASGIGDLHAPNLVVELKTFQDPNGAVSVPNWVDPIEPLELDAWTYYELGFLCSADPAVGTYEVWKDTGTGSTQVGGGTNRTIKMPGQVYRRIQMGLCTYQADATTPSQATIWVDRAYFGTSRRGP